MRANRIRIVSIFTAIIVAHSAYSNPFIPEHLNEILVDSTGWEIEFINVMDLSYSPSYLKSSSDTVNIYALLPDTELDYWILTQDSLSENFTINPDGDRIVLSTLNSPDEEIPLDSIIFGSFDDAVITNPGLGQSICRYSTSAWGGRIYYLDNSPTIGQNNDAVDATGTVEGIVTDTSLTPLSGVKIVYEETYYDTSIVHTNDSGYYSFSYLACNHNFRLWKSGYLGQHHQVQIYPDSTLTMNFQLVSTGAGITDNEPTKPDRFKLNDNFPNPFNPVTTISYDLPKQSHVRVTIYNILGQEIDMILDETKPAGTYTLHWDASQVASGIYFNVWRQDSCESRKK